MDKETLSRFSWIIISLIIIAVILAFVFSLVWILGNDSIDSSKDILVMGSEETGGGGKENGAKPTVTVGKSYFGRFEYKITGTGFDSVRFYKNGKLVKTVADSTGGQKELKFDNDVKYKYDDKISVKCYRKDILVASGNGVYDFIDTVKPVITVDHLDSYYNKGTITIRGTATDSDYNGRGGSGIVSLTVNGVSVTVKNDNSWSTDVKLVSGANTIVVIAKDGSGNFSDPKNINVYYDNVKPILTVSDPNKGTMNAPGYAYTETYTVKGTVSDGDGIGISTVTVNGETATVNKDGTWNCTITLSPTEITTVSVVATDKLGNTTTSDTKYLRWINWIDTEDKALQFISNEPFSISAPGDSWDGNMYYHNGFGWQEWKGEKISAEKQDSLGSKYCLYIRGEGNTKVTKTEPNGDYWAYNPWRLDGTAGISCNGNIETLLNYTTANGKNHPVMAEYCYAGMFANCANLVKAPSLPATELSNYCYLAMFNGCENLVEAPPELPAEQLTLSCYRGMFDNCKMLTKAPKISATTAASHSCDWMFARCTSLEVAPELPATVMAEYCYYFMFGNCTSLRTAPALPATTLANDCYRGMFQGCTALTGMKALQGETVARLPATSMAERCYNAMFENCTSLVTAPEINATRMAKFCCQYMFKNCSALKNAPSKLPATQLFLRADNDALGLGGYDGSHCYASMFEGCVSLTKAPELCATSWMAYASYQYMFKDCTSLTDVYDIKTNVLTSYCCEGMFQNCTSLVKAPSMPNVTTVNEASCKNMFLGCTSLKTVPDKIPATTLGANCYENMFRDCTSLKVAPKLPATTLADACYMAMFNGCTALTDAPDLPAEILTPQCYLYMFYNCISLEAAPELPALRLAHDCYNGMFKGCTSLTVAPDLPARSVATYAYANMFSGCISLEKAPELPATYLDTGCYEYMFLDCKSLTSIPELPAAELKASCYKSMFSGCSNIKLSESYGNEYNQSYYIDADTSGVDSLKDMFLGTGGNFKGTPNINSTYYLHGNIEIVTDPRGYLEFVSMSDFSIKTAAPGWTNTMEYNTGNGWTVWDGGEIKPGKDDKGCYYIYIRGTGNNVVTGTNWDKRWIMTGSGVDCNGNIETLLDYKRAGAGEHPQMGTNCYRDMFISCTSLVKAPDLPATVLSAQCYEGMFYECTNLRIAPSVIPAESLAEGCCRNMFYGCTSLESAPALPATVLDTECYYGMFKGCSTLTTAPALPATTLANSCYMYMFSGCTNLTAAPSLSATSLEYRCYCYMFQNCSSLEITPALPATSLKEGCYDGMFSGCRNLTAIPYLPATVLQATSYCYMFNGCTNIKLSATPTDQYTQPYKIPANNGVNYPIGNMFTGTSGTFTGTPNYDTIYYVHKDIEIVGTPCLEFVSDKSFSISANDSWDGTLEYSTDGGSTWQLWTGSAINSVKDIKDGRFHIYLRGKGNTMITGTAANSTSWKLTSSAAVECNGNIETLLDYPAVMVGKHPTMGSNCYANMFAGWTNLVSVPELPATELADACYLSMFWGCTGLKEIPYLPATELKSHCYNYMFYKGITNVYTSATGEYTTKYVIPANQPDSSVQWPISQMFGIDNNINVEKEFAKQNYFYLHKSIKVVYAPTN